MNAVNLWFIKTQITGSNIEMHGGGPKHKRGGAEKFLVGGDRDMQSLGKINTQVRGGDISISIYDSHCNVRLISRTLHINDKKS